MYPKMRIILALIRNLVPTISLLVTGLHLNISPRLSGIRLYKLNVVSNEKIRSLKETVIEILSGMWRSKVIFTLNV
jgi:hypothetical protein